MGEAAAVSLSVKARWLGIGAAALLLAIGGGSVIGSIILIDEGGDIGSIAVVTSGGASQQLTRLPGGIFAGIARMEGQLGIRCRGGGEQRRGYITPHMSEWSKIPADGVCGAVRADGVNDA